MLKTSGFYIVLTAAVVLALPGCFRNPRGDADAEFRSLMENQWSASGSDLTYETCGWPVSGGMKLKSLNLNFFPDSSIKSGRGYAEISAGGEGFTCGGKVFFIYDYRYTGGHGYSGGTEIYVGLFHRESEVDEKISSPASAAHIETGKKIEGELASSDIKLPDGSPADYYFLELKDASPAIKFSDVKGTGIQVKGAVYQDRMLMSGLTDYGVRLKPGRVIILVTAGGKRGKYSFTVEELTEKEKSGLR